MPIHFFDCLSRKKAIKQDNLELSLVAHDATAQPALDLNETTPFGGENGADAAMHLEALKVIVRDFFAVSEHKKYKELMVNKACAGDKRLHDYYRDAVIALEVELKKHEKFSSENGVSFRTNASFLLDAIIMHGKEEARVVSTLDQILVNKSLHDIIHGLRFSSGEALRTIYRTVCQARETEKNKEKNQESFSQRKLTS